MVIRNQKNFFAGLIFLLVGLGFAYASAQYRIGTPARMGPGYFPLVLGSLLALLGGGVMFFSLSGESEADGRITGFNFRSLFAIVFATILFALLVKSAGLLVTAAVVAFVSSFASPGTRLKVALANVVIQTIIAYAVFHYLLGLQIPLLPTFLAH